jgi:hypothetical protein
LDGDATTFGGRQIFAALVPLERGVMAEPNLPQTGIPPLATGAALKAPEETARPAGIRPAAPASLDIHAYSSAERWLHRISVLLFVFVCAVVGMLLVILPWRPEWTDNHLLLGYPQLRDMLGNGFVRGLCTGLGILDVWIGFSEAIHYHEDQRS